MCGPKFNDRRFSGASCPKQQLPSKAGRDPQGCRQFRSGLATKTQLLPGASCSCLCDLETSTSTSTSEQEAASTGHAG